MLAKRWKPRANVALNILLKHRLGSDFLRELDNELSSILSSFCRKKLEFWGHKCRRNLPILVRSLKGRALVCCCFHRGLLKKRDRWSPAGTNEISNFSLYRDICHSPTWDFRRQIYKQCRISLNNSHPLSYPRPTNNRFALEAWMIITNTSHWLWESVQWQIVTDRAPNLQLSWTCQSLLFFDCAIKFRPTW